MVKCLSVMVMEMHAFINTLQMVNLIKSWGNPGSGPGEFDLPHCVRVDPRNRLLVADRENNRIQFFTLDGEFIQEWTDLLHQIRSI